MKTKRRDFLKITGLTGIGLMGGSLLNEAGAAMDTQGFPERDRKGSQLFNMSGYAAPKIETVRVGFIGLGMRGPGAVNRISHIEGVEIKGLCDLRENKAQAALKSLSNSNHNPTLYFGKDESWKEMVDREDLDLIYICTPWHLHTPMAVYAMEAGKHVAIEVPAATTLEECWQLVETSERTRKHCMMLENCCYDFFELLTLNMARQGYFGEIIHAEGAYIHDLLDLNFNKNGYQNMWRLKENYKNANVYPTHGLGPVCQILNINRGDKMEYLTSMASNDFHMAKKAEELAKTDPFYKEFVGKNYRGNMNITTIRTQLGKTIVIQHDVSSPRPYSRLHVISGTKGYAQKYPTQVIAQGHEEISKDDFKKLEEQYTPEIVKKVGDMAKRIGGHGGMDFMMDWRLIDCLRNGLPLDQDVYDAASWSAITPLSEKSIENRSNSIDIPDFTRGSWKRNAPVELTLTGGGTTNVLA